MCRIILALLLVVSASGVNIDETLSLLQVRAAVTDEAQDDADDDENARNDGDASWRLVLNVDQTCAIGDRPYGAYGYENAADCQSHCAANFPLAPYMDFWANGWCSCYLNCDNVRDISPRNLEVQTFAKGDAVWTPILTGDETCVIGDRPYGAYGYEDAGACQSNCAANYPDAEFIDFWRNGWCSCYRSCGNTRDVSLDNRPTNGGNVQTFQRYRGYSSWVAITDGDHTCVIGNRPYGAQGYADVAACQSQCLQHYPQAQYIDFWRNGWCSCYLGCDLRDVSKATRSDGGNVQTFEKSTPAPTPDPTPSPTHSPTPAPTPPPTPPPTPSPTPAPTTTTTTTTADDTPELINLAGKLTNNNLGNFGPSTGDANIRYSSVTSSGVDLVVTSNRGDAYKQDFNGLKPSTGLGRISQMSGNSYEYNFAFQNSGSPATVPKFVFTVFDVDANVRQAIKETVTVCGAAAILLTPTTRLTATRGDDECWSITPTMISASDNVHSLSGLSDVQKDHAFSALFNDASSFTVRASLSASAKKTENRALLFSFTAVEGFFDQSQEEEISEAPPQTCDEVSLAMFAGKQFEVSQTSTYWGSSTFTYIIEIGGDIVQQTSNADYLIGKHESYSGKREIFGSGDRCGSTPRRATVTYTFGSDMKLLSANEPSMCVYEYAIQLPETDCAVLR